MSFLRLESLAKSFGDLRVLDAISLAVAEGEVLALLGPSGSGKTTLLRLLAGFEVPDGGRILLAGDDVAPLPPARRRFGMVFQHYALFPHLTVGQNVAFGLAGRDLPQVEVERTVADALRQVDLAGFEERRPSEISGGQQQRVALARALAISPRVLLLDEPLSNLDPALRERTRHELRAAIERIGITTVLVTHEQEEAFDLGDRVAVLHQGRLEQVGRPEELYEQPASRFVATFVGRAAVLPGQVASADGEVEIEGVGVAWRAPSARVLANGALVDLVVRPEGLGFVAADADDPAGGAVRGRVSARRYAGSVTLYRVELLAPRAAGDGDGDGDGDGHEEAVGELEVAVAERGVAAAAAAAAAVGTEVFVAPRPEGPAPHAVPAAGPRPARGAR